MPTTLYNRKGTPIAYLDARKNVFLFNGDPAAYVHKGSIFTFSGKHLGRFSRGWVRDNDGACVFFTELATGGPERPEVANTPNPRAPRPRPMKATREKAPAKKPNQSSWSRLSSERFFNQ